MNINILFNIMPAKCKLCDGVTYTRVVSTIYDCNICEDMYPIYKCLTCDKYLCKEHLQMISLNG